VAGTWRRDSRGLDALFPDALNSSPEHRGANDSQQQLVLLVCNILTFSFVSAWRSVRRGTRISTESSSRLHGRDRLAARLDSDSTLSPEAI
jgi:hypothetical protein